MKFAKIAFLFPGQGAQYVGMGKEFAESFSIAKETFEEADDLLGRHLSTIIFNGPEQLLTETKNSQTGIYVTSIALFRVLNSLFPQLTPFACAGLSLGEYTALTASKKLSFSHCLPLVQHRGIYMNDACESTKGTMAVIMGLSSEDVEKMVKELNLPHDLWTANYNCPGQVVISGTLKGVELGSAAAKAKGAKRVLPLQVHGAFHSGLMQSAEERLSPHIQAAPIQDNETALFMNVTGKQGKEIAEIKENLIKQVTHSVRWEQEMKDLSNQGIDLFIEIGCGKVLSGFNKRIGLTAPTVSIEKVSDLKELESLLLHG